MEEKLENKIYFFDTTLRDGQQTTGVDFTVDDKIKFSNALDELGLDYIEGGWPGSNQLMIVFLILQQILIILVWLLLE